MHSGIVDSQKSLQEKFIWQQTQTPSDPALERRRDGARLTKAFLAAKRELVSREERSTYACCFRQYGDQLLRVLEGCSRRDGVVIYHASEMT